MAASNDYAVGNVLHLTFKRDASTDAIPLQITILETYLPFTLAAECKVKVTQLSSCSEQAVDDICVLKLYDRRCTPKTRQWYAGAQEHSEDLEQDYQRYIDKYASCTSSDGSRVEWKQSDLKRGAKEAYAHWRCEEMFENESFAYQQCSNAQGLHLPKVLGYVAHQFIHSDQALNESSLHRSLIPGILLEYIPSSLILDNVLQFKGIPSSAMLDLCQRALSIVRAVAEYDVINQDIGTHNILLACGDESTFRRMAEEDPSSLQTIRLCIIDFGLSRIRYEDETDAEWAMAKDIEQADLVIQGCFLDIFSDGMEHHKWKWQEREWLRRRSAEEQAAYEADTTGDWGLHPHVQWNPTLFKRLWLQDVGGKRFSIWDHIPRPSVLDLESDDDGEWPNGGALLMEDMVGGVPGRDGAFHPQSSMVLHE